MKSLNRIVETKEDRIMGHIQTIIFNWEWGSDSKRCLNHVRRLVNTKGYKRPVELIKKVNVKEVYKKVNKANKALDRINNNLNKLRNLR